METSASEPNPGAGVTSVIVRNALRGDAAALRKLVERFTALLVAVARRRIPAHLRTRLLAEDLVQEVWERALPQLPTFDCLYVRVTPSFVKFLTTILHYCLQNELRERVYALEVPLEPPGTDRKKRTAALPADTASVVRDVVRREVEGIVSQAIEGLGELDRALVVLRAMEGLPMHEVASKLSMAPNSATKRYRRALAKLRARLPGSVLDELGDD